MIKRIKTIRWNEGVSEMLSFAIIIPFILFLICAIISSAQISIAKQRLTVFSYSACRAAVVCEDESYAENRADAVLNEIYGSAFIDGGYNFRIPSSTDTNNVYYTMELIGENPEWKKGNMIRLTVYQYITPLMPFTEGYRSESVVMMIENGIDSGIVASDTN